MKRKTEYLMVICAGLILIVNIWLIIDAIEPKPPVWQLVEPSPEFSLVSIYKIETHRRRSSGREEWFFHLQDGAVVYNASRMWFHSLNYLDLFTGKIERYYFEKPLYEIADNQDTIFIARSESRPIYAGHTLKRSGSISVTAFDVNRRTVVWSDVFAYMSYSSYMNANDNTVEIHGAQDRGLDRDGILIDAKTGNFLEAGVERFGDYSSFFLQSGEEIKYVQMIQSVDNRHILGTFDSIIGIDATNNSIIWQKDFAVALATNIAVADGVVCFFTQAGVLGALDAQTGDVLGSVRLEPTEFEGVYPIQHSWTDQALVADEDNVVLYFGETKQLFFFKFQVGD